MSLYVSNQTLDDLLKRNHFYGFKASKMTEMIKWACPRTLDFAVKTLQWFFIREI